MKIIKMIPVSQLEFNPQEFVVYPYGQEVVYDYKEKEVMEAAVEAAKHIDEVCICEIKDDLGTYRIATSCSKGCSLRYVLFNATECGRSDAEMRAVTFNTGRGALSRYWYDRFIKFKKGGIV